MPENPTYSPDFEEVDTGGLRSTTNPDLIKAADALKEVGQNEASLEAYRASWKDSGEKSDQKVAEEMEKLQDEFNLYLLVNISKGFKKFKEEKSYQPNGSDALEYGINPLGMIIDADGDLNSYVARYRALAIASHKAHKSRESQE